MGGGKSGGAGTTYDYFGTLACGICTGPVDELVGIILDGSAVWPPNAKSWPLGSASFEVASGDMYVFDAQVWVAQKDMTVPANPANTDDTIPGNNSDYWVEYTFARDTDAFNDFTITTSDGTSYGTLRYYWGLSTQTVDFFLEGANNDAGENHPGYAGISYCIPIDFLLGQQVQSAPNLEMIARRKPAQTVVIGDAADIVDGQCNLAAWMAEVLTSENGIGLDPAMLDATSFNLVATYLQANEQLYGASPLIDTADTLRNVCDQFTQMIDGFIRYNPSTKLIELGVYEHGVTPEDYTLLTEDSLTERPQLKSMSWQQTYSRCTVRYNDRQLNFQQTSLHADDPRAWAVLKSVRELSVDRPWITRAAQALLHGRETLRVVGHAQMTGTLTVRREIARNIRAGDYVLLDVDIEPNEQTITQFFRVTKRTIPITGPIKLEVTADNTLAAIPWNGKSAPVVNSNATVPAVENFRILEVPTILSGARGAVAPLVQRPSNLIIACSFYFDTDAEGTFQSLGNFSGFAARGTLHANITATDGTITVDVDTTQPDADFFTQQFSDNEAADDTMLAFIVQKISDAGHDDDNQIAEDGSGYAEIEICSVSTQTLVSAGRYTLTVLRGRQNTTARAFNSANSEVWLIPRANVASFTAALFSTLRANRKAGLTPAYGQFRFCPNTFVSQLPLSDATSESFRWPLASLTSPILTLTQPATSSLNFTNQNYPIAIPVSGTWNDPDGNLVEIKVLLRNTTETSDRTVIDYTFAPAASMKFGASVQVEGPGNYIIKCVARYSPTLVSEVDIPVTVSGTAAKTCSVPNILDLNGNPLMDGSALVGIGKSGQLITGKGYFSPYGPLKLFCTTPGATIYFQTTGIVNNGGTIGLNSAQQIYNDGTLEPWNMPFWANQNGEKFIPTTSLSVWAVAAGMAQSAKLTINLINTEVFT